MGCLFFIIIIGVMVFTTKILTSIGVDESTASIFGFIALVATVVGLIVWSKKEEEKEIHEKQELHNKEYDRKRKMLTDYNMPIDCKRFRHASGYAKIPNGRWVNLWKDGEYLNLLTDKGGVEKHRIPLSDISFYSIKGDVRQETETTGGDATVAETVMAEGMLGTAAAMRRNQVIQNIETIDERKTIINAIIDGKSSFMFFEGAELYNYLLESLPEKEQSFVAMNK